VLTPKKVAAKLFILQVAGPDTFLGPCLGGAQSIAAMKMAQLELKTKELLDDTIQTPFSFMVVRQRRMKSYRNVTVARDH
jgi:hypothetical protein